VKFSFKYRFIVSFVLLEAFFLALIVSVNVTFISATSNRQMRHHVEATSKMAAQLLATPMSVYDLATIDATLERVIDADLKAVRVRDHYGRELGSVPEGLDAAPVSGENADLRYRKVKVDADGIDVGTVELWFDALPHIEAVEANRRRNFWIVAIGLLFSTATAWIIGHGLARRLEELSGVAREIEANNKADIPVYTTGDEIETLSRSMSTMQSMIRKRTRSLEESSRRLQAYSDIIDRYVSISRTDLEGRITYVSSAFCTISGYTKEELLGKTHKMLRHPEVSDTLYKSMWETITKGGVWSAEFKNLTKEGKVYWVDATITPEYGDDGQMIGYYAIRHNVSDKKVIQELANTDTLTKVHNRSRLDQELQRLLHMQQRYGTPFCLIMVDIDHFKQTNDTYGHLEGDRVLVRIAQLLKERLRSTDIIGRWGGEEFLIMAPHTDLERAAILAEQLRAAVAETDFGTVGFKSISLGIAAARVGEEGKELLARADRALYGAKNAGRNRVVSDS